MLNNRRVPKLSTKRSQSEALTPKISYLRLGSNNLAWQMKKRGAI